ncbi:MAG: hypothetical protein DRJ09_05080 [Bacteroidetes bacterium]|nr:MAG: hypothetical protein DRJ09_05080 [Bacteroidota bacterium]
MKQQLFIVLIFLLPMLSWAQQMQSVSINWLNDGVETGRDYRVVYPVFKGSVTHRDFATLPCYNTTIPVLSNQTIKATVEAIEADTLGFATEHYADEDILTEDFQVRVQVNRGVAHLFVLPIKKQGDKIIRLKKFNIVTETVLSEDNKAEKTVLHHYNSESVLNSGDWYKIGVLTSGIYKLTYSDLQNLGIDVDNINPEKIQIYGQFSGMLSEANDIERADDLLEDAIKVVGEEDGAFNTDDYILFAAQGSVIWRYNPFSGKYEHKNNIYSDTTFYFLTLGDTPGKRVAEAITPTDPPEETFTSFDDYATVDNDLENVALSGKLWLGERFSIDTNSRQFVFDFPNRLTSQPVSIKMHVVARGVEYTYFRVKVNGQEVIDSSRINYVGSNSGYYAKEVTKTRAFVDDNEMLTAEVIRETDDLSAVGWLDYLELNAECNLKWRQGQMLFSNHRSMNVANVYRFVLSDVPQNGVVWDLTDVTNPKAISLERTETDVAFTVQGAVNQHFAAFDGTRFLSPVSAVKIPNQNLHDIGNLNLIIVTPELFLPQAQQLADWHEQKDNLISKVVTTGQIYNEFSSGMQDISAIRDFVRMLYKRGNFGSKPGYLLLYGDASFDYKNRVKGNTNMVPIFESVESLKFTTSFATDDFFGLLDDDEGFNSVGDLDVGIGRLPVSTTKQADVALAKIKNYTKASQAVCRDWRNTICFVADDQDMNLHLNQAQSLVAIVDTAYPELNINKIYADAYFREKTSSGYRYPDAHEAIKEQVDGGALIVNYTGHGGLTGWSEEHILDMPSIRSFDNYNRLPLFITATCEFSRFDDPLFLSAGEEVFLNEKGGSIALMTTTRLAYAHANIALNSRIYYDLKNTEGNELPRLGDLMRMSKVPSNTNFLNFALLGDPALMLAFPKYNVVTTSMQTLGGKATDTVQAMATITVKGEIRQNGAVVEDFNGYLFPKVFDKQSVYETRANDPRSFKQDFTLFDKLLFTGKSTVSNGQFHFTFVVPKEIAYQYGQGRISYYAVDSVNYTDASGYYENLVVGGIDQDAMVDNEGPDITMYINEPGIKNNDAIGKDAILYAQLSDPNGINHTGVNIGRDILFIIDEDYTNAQVVNSYFLPELDSYTSGTIEMPLNDLSDGMHTAAIRAWDLQGNSGIQQISFYVKTSGDVGLNNVMAYPNPFKSTTNLKFYNLSGGNDLKVTISIFTITGQLVGTQYSELSDAGEEVEISLNWQSVVNGGGDPGSGIFIYEMVVSGNNGSKEIVRQKLIKLAD